MTTTHTDSDIIALSRADPHVFAELFERHFRSVHAFLARRAGPQLADDLAGDVFVAALSARAGYDTSYSNARPWLYGIARNLLLAELRRAERSKASAARWAASVGPAAVDPFDEADARVDAASSGVAAALAALPSTERDVLTLVAWEGLTPAEAAVVLGIPQGTARSRLHRARVATRCRLAPEALARPSAALPLSTGGTR